ncbi:MAG: hypothetical protein ABIF01_03375, partial [Candidatus Micrarchaeota archaeon]
MSFKRGQAAMEYLMTYGWAILVIVIVLAALLYLGVFNLAGKTPDLCQFQVGLQCSSFRLDASDDNLSLTIINGYQEKINITQAACRQQGTPTTWTEFDPHVSISAQQSQTINIDEIQDGS